MDAFKGAKTTSKTADFKTGKTSYTQSSRIVPGKTRTVSSDATGKVTQVSHTSGKPKVTAAGAGGAALQVGGRMAKGGMAAASSTTKNGGLVAILIAVFAIVSLAHLRGGANLNVPHALFGGFVLAFLLSLVNVMNQHVAVMFAVLVLIAALIEYGPAALGGLGNSGGKALPTSNPNSPSALANQAEQAAVNGGPAAQQAYANSLIPGATLYDANGNVIPKGSPGWQQQAQSGANDIAGALAAQQANQNTQGQNTSGNAGQGPGGIGGFLQGTWATLTGLL